MISIHDARADQRADQQYERLSTNVVDLQKNFRDQAFKLYQAERKLSQAESALSSAAQKQSETETSVKNLKQHVNHVQNQLRNLEWSSANLGRRIESNHAILKNRIATTDETSRQSFDEGRANRKMITDLRVELQRGRNGAGRPGPRGERGPQGERGLRGEQGPQGPAGGLSKEQELAFRRIESRVAKIASLQKEMRHSAVIQNALSGIKFAASGSRPFAIAASIGGQGDHVATAFGAAYQHQERILVHGSIAATCDFETYGWNLGFSANF